MKWKGFTRFVYMFPFSNTVVEVPKLSLFSLNKLCTNIVCLDGDVS